MLNTHRNEIEITSNCDGRRKNLKDEHMKKSWENREERDRERWEEWMKPCELPKLKRLFIDFPALNSNEERLPKQKQQNEMIKKKKNSKSGTPHPSREPAESVSQKLQPLSISKSECPLGCAFGQAHSSAISTHTHAQTQTQTRPCLCPCPCTQPPRHSKMFAQHNYRFGGLWEKYTSYELWDTRYKIQYGVGEKKEVTTAAVEPRPLQQRVESVLKETNTNEIKNERQVGESMEYSTSSMTGSKHRMWMRWGGECGSLHCRCSLTSEMYNEESNWQSNCANTLSW